MKVSITATDSLQYLVESPHAKINVGANLNNETEKYFRPMELILTGLATCSAIDIENILIKQKLQYSNFQIEVKGQRAETIPAVFTKIDLLITLTGNIPNSKLERAIRLTTEKYCSVYQMLQKEVEINYSYKIQPLNEPS